MVEPDWKVAKDVVRTDERGRLTLGQGAKLKSYRVMINQAGQILLDPVASIPERELWLWRNPDAAGSIQRGLEHSKTGETYDLGSFAQYAEWEIED
jgi:hypothetical protein